MYVNPTPMSLPSLLLTKFTSNDICWCWVDIGSKPPFLMSPFLFETKFFTLTCSKTTLSWPRHGR